MRRFAASLLLILGVAVCAGPDPLAPSVVFDPGRASCHIRELASDDMEGRAPGSKGEELATAYITEVFRSISLETSFQAVPLVGITTESSPLVVAKANDRRRLDYGNAFMAWTPRQIDSVSVTLSELVFVGYGVVAPEYGWNDFKGFDAAGKILLVLVNDPPIADPGMFGGEAMTYYGRWTCKFEEAARQGAEGALIVHETQPAGYPWEIVRGSWSGEQFDTVRGEGGGVGR